MNSRFALCVGLAAVALATSGQAMAREVKPVAPSSTPSRAEAPWFERFTFGSEVRSGANAWVPRAEPKASITIDPKSRWGVTFGLKDAPQNPTTPRAGQASAGAFYQVSPKVRVGGAVVLPESSLRDDRRKDDKRAREPGVKVESAFRF